MDNFSWENLNVFAVLLSTLLYFFLGALWYSPVLFGTIWAKIQNFDMTDTSRKKGLWKLLLFSFLNTLITSFVMALFAGAMQVDTVAEGMCLGSSTAVGFMVTSISTTFVYESRPLKLYFIDIGYHFAGFLITGVVLALFN